MCLYSSTKEFKVAESPITCWKVMMVIDGDYHGPYFDGYIYGHDNTCESFKDELTEMSLDYVLAERRSHSGFIRFVRWIGSHFNNNIPVPNDCVWTAKEGFHAYSNYNQAYAKWFSMLHYECMEVKLVKCEIPAGTRYYEGVENDIDSMGYCAERIVIPEIKEGEGHEDNIGRFYYTAKTLFRKQLKQLKGMAANTETLYVTIDNPYSMYPNDKRMWHYHGCFKFPGVTHWVFTNSSMPEIAKRIKEDFPQFKKVVFESERAKAARQERGWENGDTKAFYPLWPFV